MAGAVMGDDSAESKENSQTTPDLETQKKEIGLLLKAPLLKGETWYLVDSRWLKCWKKYVGFDSWDVYGVGEEVNHPGPVDNRILFKDVENNILKQHLIDELDYNLMPTEAWEKLVACYGIVEGQQPIQRKVVDYGMYLKQCKVEVYLLEFKLCQNSDLETVVLRHFSKGDTIGDITSLMKEVFEIPEDAETRLWNKYLSNTYELLDNKEQSVQDVGLYSGQVLVIERKNEDGTWQRQTPSNSKSNFSSSSMSSSTSSGYGSSSSYSSYGSSYSSWDYSGGGRKAAPQPGLSGLSNLGNTCFMNSALQCLSNTPHLTKYFVREEYKDELNYDNPLGMRGEIAKAYASLLEQIWTGKYSAVAPRPFKTQVGRFAPQFSGYQQQDSQELLAFLLDGLHEDLNRIQKKPYIEVKDADNRPDKVVAQEAWQNHRKRNDSIIVDIFHGQFKSTLVCPDCEKISVTFDPFCYLSLPLPVKKERNLEVFLVRNDPMKKPILFKLTVPKMGNVSDLLLVLSKEANVPKDKMIVADVYNHRFHKIFSSTDALSSILDRDDIFVYEVASNTETTVIPVYMREKRMRLSTYSTGSKYLFGLPLLVGIPNKGLTYGGLYNLLVNRMRRYVTPPQDESGIDCDKEKEIKTNAPVATDVEMSEIKTEEHGPETEEDELEKATQNVHVNGDEDDGGDEVDADGDDSQQKDSKKVKKKSRLFSMTLVNAFGSSDLQPLVDDDKALTLSGRSYLALDWSSKTKEKSYDIEAADDSDQHDSVTRKPAQKKNCVRLSDCIEMFTSKERLGANDPWYCPTCKKHQQATKKFDLWALPEVLVVHLKRFSYNSYWRDKLDTLVDFPLRGLDMTKNVINHEQPRPVYDLIAVSNHYGGMGGGHYTAYARNCHDSNWYSFDDSSVTPIEESQIVSKAAYVLFYQRRRSHRVSVLSDKGEAASADVMTAEDDDWVDEGEDPDADEDMDTK